MVGLIGWWVTIRGEACELARITEALDDAERSLAELDPDSFETSMERIRSALGCVDVPLTPALAARVHRAVGMRAFAARGPIAAGAFAAARRITPGELPSPELFPPGSPVSEAWSAVSVDALRTRPLPPP